MRKLIGAAICAAVFTGAISVNAQPADCTPPVQGEKEFLGPIVTSVVIPALGTIAGKVLDYLRKKVTQSPSRSGSEAPPVPGASGASACVDRSQPLTGPVSAGIAYTLYRINAQRQVAIARDNDVYKAGEGVALTVTNNVPGILDVWNINGAGQRTKIDTVQLESLGTIVLPHQVQGFYQFDNATGNEILKLAFFPCVGYAEDMHPLSDPQVFAQMATFTQLRPEIAPALPSCLPGTAREAALGTPENLVPTPNAEVAVAVKAAASASTGAKFPPVIVTLRLRRG